jgi:penicillin amidase
VLAQLDGEIPLAGLKQPVEVARDRWGVPHIYAQNQDDLFFAQGFVAAQDRLFQIDMWRRIGLGETAEILGEQAIEEIGLPGCWRIAATCKRNGRATLRIPKPSPPHSLAASTPASIRRAKLPIEFQILGYEPKKWRPEDILGRMSGIIMTSNWQREVARARLIAAVGVGKPRRSRPIHRGNSPRFRSRSGQHHA